MLSQPLTLASQGVIGEFALDFYVGANGQAGLPGYQQNIGPVSTAKRDAAFSQVLNQRA